MNLSTMSGNPARPQHAAGSPCFSIVVPCWNAADTLEDTLASLRAQSLTDWEALLIDDGSTDATEVILAAAARSDPRFRVLRNPGKGPSTARNLAISAARGEVLAFCDADDLFFAGKLAQMQDVFRDPTVAAAFGRIAFFDGVRSRAQSSLPDGPLSVPMLLGENPVCTMSNLCVRSSVFRATGGFDTQMVHNEDLEWLIRLVGDGHTVVGVNSLMTGYRTSATGLSANLPAMREGRRAAIRTAARYGFRPEPADEAIHLRYLARRALRTDAPRFEALRLALAGVRVSPRGFFSNPRRGAMTALGALLSPVLPRAIRTALFAS